MRWFRTCVVAGLSLLISSLSLANDVRPVSLVTGMPPGGASDTLARITAKYLTDQLERTVVVENKPGASGSIAAQIVARARPDGGTFLFTPSTHSTNPALYSNLSYDTRRDFKAIGIVASTPYVLVVHPSLPAKDVASLIAYLKKNPQQALFATASAGSSQHIAAALLGQLSGIGDINYVHYKGSASALTDLLSGRVPMMFDNIALMLPYLKDGRLRAIAVSSKNRSELIPNIPTIAESGYPSFDVNGWFGLFAPTGTPQSVINSSAKALATARSDENFSKKIVDIGGQLISMDAEASEKFVQQETVRMQEIIRKTGVRIE